MKTTLSTLAATGLLAGSALAGGTITSGNASLQLVGFPAFSSTLGDANMLTDTGGPDQVYKYTWYYRTPNNNINRYFSSLDTPSEVYSGDTSTITYTNAGPGVAGAERFDAVVQTKITDGAVANKVGVVGTCQFKSHANTAVTYQVFVLIDVDLAGGGANPGTDDSLVLNTTTFNAHQTEASSANFANIQAVNPTRWQIDSGSALRALLASGAGSLSNAAGPFNGDAAAAFQWTLTLQPGEQVTLTAGFAINDAALCASPTISQNPSPTSACVGGPASFSVTPGGSGPFTYAWRKGGVAIDTIANPSAATSTLNLTNVQPGDGVSYDCLVSNACAPSGVPSNAALLTVNSAPLVNQNPANALACPTSTATFTAGATGAPAPGYQWQWRRQGQGVWNNIAAGANSDGVASFQSIGGAASQTDVSAYQEVVTTPAAKRLELRCLASNTCDSVPTTTANLVICIADYDCNGALAVQDIFAFLNGWFAGLPSADVNGGGLAVSDIFDFLNAWFAGC